MIEQLTTIFYDTFGEGGDIRCYFSPGRVNLIGEHTDYNGGHVFPCALTIGTYFLVRKRQDRQMRFYSENFKTLGISERSLEDISIQQDNDWVNYPMGIIWTLEQNGYTVPQGFDLLVYGTIPNSSGLSSSASIEVGTAFFLNDFFGFGLSLTDMAKLSQYSENHYNHVACGIMDQFSIAMGKKDHAIFLDTNTLQYEYVPVLLEDAKIIISCSNKKRGLCDSLYNERRRECSAALAQIQEVVGIDSLGDLTREQFDLYQTAICDKNWKKRAKHAVSENLRTVEAVKVLQEGNLKKFGELMVASHNSLRDDFEVTGMELDTLVEAALAQEGVIGSRMTGAGFGGCTVSIVKNGCEGNFMKNVGNIYLDKIGYAADFYIAEIGDGVRRIF